MPTTTYTQIDFIDITVVQEDFINNGPNLGTVPNLTASGASGGSYSSSVGDSSYTPPSVEAAINYTWGLEHSTPTIPIPTDAHITKVTVRQTITNISGTGFLEADFEDPPATPSGGTVNTGFQCSIQLLPTTYFDPPPSPQSWLTSYSFPNLIVTDSSGLVGTPPTADANATQAPYTTPCEFVFDFTTNPNGDFPLLYCDYATFVAQFSSYFAQYQMAVNGIAFKNGVSSPTFFIFGTYATGGDITAVNLVIEVEWTPAPVVYSWDVTPTALTLPDNTITLTRPEPTDDDEDIDAVKIGDKIIKPDDPWVTLWTKVEIVINIPPDSISPDPDVDVKFRGTQFSGFVNLLTLDITTADLSGIYQLDIDEHIDNLYVHTGTTATATEVAIPSPFFVTYFVDNKEADIMHYNGTRMRVTGAGTVHQVFQSLDYINTEQFGDITLLTTNNLSPFRLANFIDQNCALRVYMTAAEDFMNVSQIVVFFKKLYTGYPQ